MRWSANPEVNAKEDVTLMYKGLFVSAQLNQLIQPSTSIVKRMKSGWNELTWLIETISVDTSMANRGKCKQSKNKDRERESYHICFVFLFTFSED